jgi:transglutaminase-like putative cysteine protease
MLKQLALGSAGVITGTLVGIYASTIPLLLRRGPGRRKALAGVTTIPDAVEACRATRLTGWDLVAFAQYLTARKFTYSRLNPWDPPAQAFACGQGYCQQQALALKQIYDRLGIPARVVFAMRCRFPPGIVDGTWEPGCVSPHSWLRVTLDGEERDVCPGATSNTPGDYHFEVLSPVRTLQPWMRPFSHLGSVLANVRRADAAQRRLRAEQGPFRLEVDSLAM